MSRVEILPTELFLIAARDQMKHDMRPSEIGMASYVDISRR